MQLYFCPKKETTIKHDKVRTVWYNHKYGLFECLDKKCKCRFTEEEMCRFNMDIPNKNPKILCQKCGNSDNVVLAGYGGENPRYKCKKHGNIFT